MNTGLNMDQFLRTSLSLILHPANHLRLPNPSHVLGLDWVLPLLLQGQHCNVWVEIPQKKPMLYCKTKCFKADV